MANQPVAIGVGGGAWWWGVPTRRRLDQRRPRTSPRTRLMPMKSPRRPVNFRAFPERWAARERSGRRWLRRASAIAQRAGCPRGGMRVPDNHEYSVFVSDNGERSRVDSSSYGCGLCKLCRRWPRFTPETSDRKAPDFAADTKFWPSLSLVPGVNQYSVRSDFSRARRNSRRLAGHFRHQPRQDAQFNTTLDDSSQFSGVFDFRSGLPAVLIIPPSKSRHTFRSIERRH